MGPDAHAKKHFDPIERLSFIAMGLFMVGGLAVFLQQIGSYTMLLG